jgi:hypothetical protein
MEKCDECNKGTIHSKKVDYILLGKNLGKFTALVCDNCNETVYDGDEFEKIEKIAKEKGLWGISAKTKVGTSGNALDVKLPKSIVEFLKLKKGQEVLIEPIDDKKFQVAII